MPPTRPAIQRITYDRGMVKSPKKLKGVKTVNLPGETISQGGSPDPRERLPLLQGHLRPAWSLRPERVRAHRDRAPRRDDGDHALRWGVLLRRIEVRGRGPLGGPTWASTISTGRASYGSGLRFEWSYRATARGSQEKSGSNASGISSEDLRALSNSSMVKAPALRPCPMSLSITNLETSCSSGCQIT